jgi:hypothetical protein
VEDKMDENIPDRDSLIAIGINLFTIIPLKTGILWIFADAFWDAKQYYVAATAYALAIGISLFVLFIETFVLLAIESLFFRCLVFCISLATQLGIPIFVFLN